jgi:hypothetical protein
MISPTTVVALPELLNAEAALTFASSLSHHSIAPDITIDFATVRASEPFGLLLAGAALRAFFKEREYRSVQASGIRAGNAAHENLAQIGFFQWIGIPVGKMPGVLDGSATWLPLTTLTRAQLDTRMMETAKPLGSVIHEECERLAKLLTHSAQAKVNGPLAYCLREVIRNVFEHAETDRCALCAQRWRDGTVELAVIDQGRGIRRSLEEKMQFDSDEEALRTALLPGVSSKLSDDPNDRWGNSGFGLFVLSELGRGLGVFRVISGCAGLRLLNDQIESEPARFKGTAIQLRVHRPKGVNFGDFIDSIILRGEDACKASSSSRASGSTRTMHGL